MGWGAVVGERVRKATFTDKLVIDLNNGVKVINHSHLLELSLIYISKCKFCSRLKSYVDFMEIFI